MVEASSIGSCWELSGALARLKSPLVSGQIDLVAATPALHNVIYADTPLKETRLFGVALDGSAGQSQPSLGESYARVGDLVATYTVAADARIQAYWRVPEVETTAPLAIVDLQVSVQTQLLDSDPRRTVLSQLPPGDVWRLADPLSGQFKRLNFSVKSRHRLQPADGTGCLLFRPRGKTYSYAEMIHPADFHDDEACSHMVGVFSIEHRLFAGKLEKGVILRARVRGALMPRDGDESLTARLHAAFLEAPPPLTT